MLLSLPSAGEGKPDIIDKDRCDDCPAVVIEAVKSELREDFWPSPFRLEREFVRLSVVCVWPGLCTIATFSSRKISFGTGMGYFRKSMTAEATPQMIHDVMAHLDPKNRVHELVALASEFISTSLPASKSPKLVVLV